MKNLRYIREQAGLSQPELAEISGVGQGTISDIELGKRKPQGRTLRKLAQSLDVEVADLYGDPDNRPLAEAPPSLQQSFNGLLEEERRAEWDAAVRSARELRESGQGRTEELLALWSESKNREEDPAERRPYLDEIGDLLQEAYDAETALVNALSEPHIADQWPEVQAADRFYIELWHLVQDAGLNIRTGNAQEERPEVVEESEAA